jgi:hypothetical protein
MEQERELVDPGSDLLLDHVPTAVAGLGLDT